jgi:hypothetical protein
MQYIAFRYLHKRNRQAEKEMLSKAKYNETQRVRSGRHEIELYDVEALLASLMMTPSWERETAAIRAAIKGAERA